MGNEVATPTCLTAPTPKANLKAASYRPFLLITFIAAIVIMATLLWPFKHAMVLALVLATLMRPLQRKLPFPLRARRTLSATVVTLVTILFILLPLSAVLALLTSEAFAFAHKAVTWFKAGGLNDVGAWVQQLPLPGWTKGYLDVSSSLDLQGIESWLMSSSGDIGLWVVWAGKGMLGKMTDVGLQLLVMVLLLFYFLADVDHLTSLLRKASPMRRDQEDAVFARFKAVSQSVLLGGLGTSVAIGVSTGIGLWIAGINPILWGAVAVVASLIPVVGTSVIMIPALIYLVATGSLKMAIFLLLYWLIVVSLIEHLVRTLFMRGKARMSVVWVFISLVGGIIMFGPLGFLYGPLALSISFVLFQVFLDAQNEEDGEEAPAPPGP